jgi:hypothetical protein
MLKTVSSITNAIGALNYKGTWNASTNTPALASGVGTKGDYYVVSVAGTTALDGISNWGVGDWVTFNGSVWQRVEGGADLNGVNLSVSGTSTLSGLTASTVLSLNGSKEVVSTATTGTGNVMLASTIRFTDTTGNATPSISGCDPHYPATLQVANATPYTITNILGRSTGQVLVIINRGAGDVTISRAGASLNGSVDQVLTNGDCISLLFDDNIWFQIAPVSVNG